MCRKLIYLTFFVLVIELAAGNYASAQCGVIYYDDFNGSGSTDLNGTTPDITTNDATWQAFCVNGSYVYADGSYGGLAGKSFIAALPSPFIPDIGAVYELSATVDVNYGEWTGIGFLSLPPIPPKPFYNYDPVLWSLVRPTGSSTKDKAYIGPGSSNPVGDSNTISAATVKVRIEANSATNWRITWYFDDLQQFQRTINPSTYHIGINYVGFGSNNQNPYGGTIRSFKLEKIPVATSPSPTDNSLVNSTTVSLQWQPGECAAKHDVYLGTNFADDVSNATTSTPAIYKGRQDSNNYNAAGLIPKTTYYWRIDEVNVNDPNIWIGRVWSFRVELLTAYNPDPANEDSNVDHNANLTWSPGFKAKFHDVYLGTSQTAVTNATTSSLEFKGNYPKTTLIYEPGTLKFDTPYYWRIDEVNGVEFWKGDVWSFKTSGPRCIATNPSPAHLATNVPPDVVLGWTSGVYADKHDVYLGTDETTMTPVRENQNANTYDPCGLLELGRTYYWRIDEINETDIWPGDTWKFTVAGYRIVDNFESYNPSLEDTWKTGGNATVSLSIDPVHEGNKAMAYSYKDKIAPYYSEANAATTGPNRLEIDPNWLAGGVKSLSLWFKGRPAGVEPSGSFTDNGDGTYTITADGAGIGVGPEGINFIALSAGGYHSLALKSDGSIVGWGNNSYGQATPPAGNNFSAISAGRYHSLALKSDGSIIGRGWNYEGQLNIPEPNSGFKAIAAGGYHSLGLKQNGSIVGWGDNSYGQTCPPSGNFVAIAAGGYHSLALRSDGTIVGWGRNDEGPASSGPGPYHDEFHYDFKEVTAEDPWDGLVTIIARVESISNTNAWAKAGVMIRDSLDPNSANGFMCIMPDLCVGAAFQYRTETGSATSSIGATDVNAPYWVKLELDYWYGNLRAYTSPDGIEDNWTQIGDFAVRFFDEEWHSTMTFPIYVGLAVTSSSYGEMCAADFNNVSITAGEMGAWDHRDIGGEEIEGSFTDKGDGTYTITAEGAGIGVPDVPLDNIIAISAGESHSLALKSGGTIIGWGDNSYGQACPPSGNFVAIAAGGEHSLAFRSDGTIVGWGDNSFRQANSGPGPYHDEFHFAYKKITDAAYDPEYGYDIVKIVARVDDISCLNAKAGVMIRDSLEPDSTHGIMCIVPDLCGGAAFQYRTDKGGASGVDGASGITPPYWVKLVLDPWYGLNNLHAFYSATGNPDDWVPIGSTQQFSTNMTLPFYVGLAVTSSSYGEMCTADFSNVTITGIGAADEWENTDIGIVSKYNEPEPMYVALEDGDGKNGKVYEPNNPYATQIDTWTEWRIDLDEFRDQWVNLSDVRRMYIGFGNKDFPEQGGAGIMYFDDIRLYPSCRPELRPAADFTNDCVVDFRDLAILANEWLITGYPIADLYVDYKVDFKDLAILAENWLME
jgi:hypothetical protein